VKRNPSLSDLTPSLFGRGKISRETAVAQCRRREEGKEEESTFSFDALKLIYSPFLSSSRAKLKMNSIEAL